jgi:hypothetical protein
MARLLVTLTSLLLIGGCSSARSDWSRGPYTAASQEFQRDQYECRRDALLLAPVPPSTGAESYRVTGPRGDTYTVRQSGLGAGVQSAGASMGAGIQQRRILEECLRARGWTTSDAPAQATDRPPVVGAATSQGAAARPVDQADIRANIAQAKAERYRELDQLEVQARPTTVPPTSPLPAALIPIDAEILTNESILSMVKAGLDESVILAKITATPARFDTRTEALIELKRAGVSDRVLTAMVGKK